MIQRHTEHKSDTKEEWKAIISIKIGKTNGNY